MPVSAAPQSYNGYVGLGKETTYGTAVAPSYFVDAFSDGFEGDNQTDYQNTTRAREDIKGEAGALDISGGLDLPANPENGLGLLLLAALGSESFATAETGAVGVHTFTPGTTTPSLSVEIDTDTHIVRYDGVAVDTLELTHAAEDRLVASVDLPASSPDSSVSAATPAYSDLRNFWFQDATISLVGTDRTADVQDLGVTFSNNVTRHWRGSRVPDKASLGRMAVEYDVTLDFETETLWEAFLGDTATPATSPQDSLTTVAVNAMWTSTEIAAGTTAYELEVNSPQAIVDTRDAQLNQNELVAENVTLTAIRDIGGIGSSVEAILTNAVTSAY